MGALFSSWRQGMHPRAGPSSFSRAALAFPTGSFSARRIPAGIASTMFTAMILRGRRS